MTIGKIRRASGFGGLCQYVLNANKEVKPKIIGGNMSALDPATLTTEFELFSTLNRRVKMPVKHFIVGFAPEDGEVAETLKASLAADYMESMGYGNSQYLVVAHSRSDHDHDHIHIIANAVDTQGKWVNDRLDWKRSQAILRDLELVYCLTPVVSSWDERRDKSQSTKRDRRIDRLLAKGIQPTEIERTCIEIQTKIDRAAPGAITLAEFCARLQSLGVEPLPRITKTGKVQGLSYRQGDVIVRGCDLDGASLPKLRSVRAIDYDPQRDLESLRAIATGRSSLRDATRTTNGRGDRLVPSDEFVKQSQSEAVSIPVETGSRAVSIPVEGGKPHTERGEGLSR